MGIITCDAVKRNNSFNGRASRGRSFVNYGRRGGRGLNRPTFLIPVRAAGRWDRSGDQGSWTVGDFYLDPSVLRRGGVLNNLGYLPKSSGYINTVRGSFLGCVGGNTPGGREGVGKGSLSFRGVFTIIYVKGQDNDVQRGVEDIMGK